MRWLVGLMQRLWTRLDARGCFQADVMWVVEMVDLIKLLWCTPGPRKRQLGMPCTNDNTST